MCNTADHGRLRALRGGSSRGTRAPLGANHLALAAALDRTSIGELLLVRRAVTAGHLGTEEVIWAVARTGLVNVELIGAPVGPGIKTSYQVNSLGGDMVAFGLTGLADDADTGFP